MARSRMVVGVVALVGLVVAAPRASGQVGPDLISSSHNDVARNGINVSGTIVGYSIGSVTCNRGDMHLDTAPNSSIRPIAGQAMFRLKTYTSPAGTMPFQRFEQVGQGWCKWVGVPVNGSSTSCGVCSGGGAGIGMMPPNCSDLYGSGFNSPSGMARRSFVNPTTGMLLGTRGGGTDETAINTRLQVAAADVTGQPAGTRFFVETTHLLPHDAQYVRPGQTVAVNAMNNAASQEININGGLSNPTLLGPGNAQVAAVTRWRDADAGVTLVLVDHDDTPNPGTPGTFIKCRFYVAAKVTNLSGAPEGPWRYEYTVYNLNSDRSAGAFSVPFPSAGLYTEYTFRHPLYHSGEAISNTPWTATKKVTASGDALEFATTPFATAQNANAIRWGTLYNFGFTSAVPPTIGTGTIGLFKPGTAGSPSTLDVPNLPVPTLPPTCTADFNGDGRLDPDDLGDFINCYFDIPACDGADFNADGSIDPDDLGDFINVYFAGC